MLGEPNAINSHQRTAFRFRPWRELTSVSALMMELSWSVLWYRMLIKPGIELSYRQALAIFGGVVVFIYIIARLLNSLNLSLGLRRVIFLGLIIANIMAGLQFFVYANEAVSLVDLIARPARSFQDLAHLLPLEFVVMMVMILVSWRGIAQLHKPVVPYAIVSRFRLGVIMFFLYGAFLPLTGDAPMMALYLFLFFSLLAMSASRIATMSLRRGGRRIRFDSQWAFGITLVILSIVGLAALAVGVIDERLFEYVRAIVSYAIYLLVLVASPILWLIMRAVFWIGSMIDLTATLATLLEIVRNISEFLQTVFAAFRKWLGVNPDELRAFFTDLARTKPWFLWGVMGLVVVAVLLAIRHYFWREEEAGEQEYQSLLDQQDLFALLRSAFRRGLRQLANSLDQVIGWRNARRRFAAARIRRIYGKLMDLCKKLGHPRPPAHTPLEFQPRMETLFPNMAGELKTITNAYLRVRYGDVPEKSQEVEQVENAWRRIALVGNERLRLYRKNRH